jgi:hypothetical protein
MRGGNSEASKCPAGRHRTAQAFQLQPAKADEIDLRNTSQIDAQWRLRFEARVHPSPWSDPGVLLHQQCSGIRPPPDRYLSPLSAFALVHVPCEGDRL